MQENLVLLLETSCPMC